MICLPGMRRDTYFTEGHVDRCDVMRMQVGSRRKKGLLRRCLRFSLCLICLYMSAKYIKIAILWGNQNAITDPVSE